MREPPKRALVFLAHGSNDPAWKLPVEAIASHAGRLNPALTVRCAYLDMTKPDLKSCIGELSRFGVTRLCVVPVFLGMGHHVRADIPRLLDDVRAMFPGVAVSLQSAVGESVQVLNLIARLAIEKEALS